MHADVLLTVRICAQQSLIVHKKPVRCDRLTGANPSAGAARVDTSWESALSTVPTVDINLSTCRPCRLLCRPAHHCSSLPPSHALMVSRPLLARPTTTAKPTLSMASSTLDPRSPDCSLIPAPRTHRQWSRSVGSRKPHRDKTESALRSTIVTVNPRSLRVRVARLCMYHAGIPVFRRRAAGVSCGVGRRVRRRRLIRAASVKAYGLQVPSYDGLHWMPELVVLTLALPQTTPSHSTYPWPGTV